DRFSRPLSWSTRSRPGRALRSWRGSPAVSWSCAGRPSRATLSVIAFPGAAAAGWAGVPLALGYFGFCGAGALVLAAIAGTRRSLGAESAAIGSLQALALALGFPFVSLSHRILTGLDSLLFGTFLG